ncbi:MAG: flagellar export chaperone FliS [Halothiobacillaceae bacterium]|nr:flagellar export chaperone FliS [Halothiobacillaceae bacterium]
MYSTARHYGINQYASVHIEGGLQDASPHRLIQMLLEGLISRMASARGALLRGDTVVRGEQLSKALAILGGLEGALDYERGGELAVNLRDLYRYITHRLLLVTSDNDVRLLDEALGLIREIKAGWDAIPASLHTAVAQEQAG